MSTADYYFSTERNNGQESQLFADYAQRFSYPYRDGRVRLSGVRLVYASVAEINEYQSWYWVNQIRQDMANFSSDNPVSIEAFGFEDEFDAYRFLTELLQYRWVEAALDCINTEYRNLIWFGRSEEALKAPTPVIEISLPSGRRMIEYYRGSTRLKVEKYIFSKICRKQGWRVDFVVIDDDFQTVKVYYRPKYLWRFRLLRRFNRWRRR